MKFNWTRCEIDRIRKILNETEGLNYLSVKDTNFMLDKICEALTVDEEQNEWIPVGERLPDPDEYILVSFENFSIPIIGRYTVDNEDSGTFRVGNEDKSFIEHDLFVNAWMPLLKPYKNNN